MISLAERMARHGLRPVRSGKVRDLYAWRDEIWLVASDRISAYDVILPTLIPDKGKILTALSRLWFERTAAWCPNHVISFELPPEIATTFPEWVGRTTRAKPVEIFPVECVARGYLAGAGWKEYRTLGTVGGHPLPAGLREAERLPEPLFTPARKNETGHDENLTTAQAIELLGEVRYAELRDLTLNLYRMAASYVAARGLILVDTKLEFGRDLQTGQVLVADEIFTPDSSRYWPAKGYLPGRAQPSFDKQYLRDYLKSLPDWNQLPPGPELPSEVVENTQRKYAEALARLS